MGGIAQSEGAERHRASETVGQRFSPRVSVVVPTLNEAANLPYVLPFIPDDVFEVILVDGLSTDDTVEVARRLLPDVRVVEQTGKGKGNALACGFAQCRGDIIVMLDADGSADPAEIPLFVAALCAGAHFVKGSRFAVGGGSADITLVRRLGNRWLTGVVNVLYLTNYSDLCYGYNAFWTWCLPHITVDCDGFEVEALINVRAAKAGLNIAEVPSYEHGRINGSSKLHTFRDGWRVQLTIFRELRRRSEGPAVRHRRLPSFAHLLPEERNGRELPVEDVPEAAVPEFGSGAVS